jgi:hypothetical protein
MNSTLPIACSLTDSEFRERRNTVLREVKQMMLEAKEIADGYVYRFLSDDDSLAQIVNLVVNLVRLERKCCQFLQFRITVEAGEGDAWLELTGAEGTKQFLASLFD